jgi:DNA-binding transcriptional LysR family regulator
MLANFDLNLLIVFHVLMEERNVTQTGQRLGRTQPAISNSLRRLRAAFDDPLFVRSPSGLVPTPRAEALAPAVAAIVAQAEDCVARAAAFVPSTAQARFVIGAPDRCSVPILLPTIETLGREAPGIVLNLRTTDRDYAVQLVSDDEVDLAVGWIDDVPPHLEHLYVYDDTFVCLSRADHPLNAQGASVSLDSILSYGHVAVSSTGDRVTAFDAALKDHGRSRQVAAVVMSFTIVPEILLRTELVGVFTQKTAEYLASRYPLKVASLPLTIPPIKNYMIWHQRFNADKSHRWVRQRIEQLFADDRPSFPVTY